MSGPKPPQPRADLIAAAAGWLAALDAGSADSAAFEAWRDADVRHAIAFAEVAATWGDLGSLRLIDAGIPPLADAAPQPAAIERGSHRRQMLRAAASATAVIVVGGGIAYRGQARDTARTRVGERRMIAAAPGVSITLNTDSCIHWRDGTPVRLWLEEGEAAIRLADGRRTELRTPAGRFLLSGGVFNARLRGGSCELAAVAGTIADDHGAHVSAGQVALAGAERLGPRSASEADLARVTAWQRDMLMLSGESLDYALAELNRYLPGKIVIGDPALSRLRLGGTFATTDPAEFLRALHASFGIRATVSANGGVVLTRS